MLKEILKDFIGKKNECLDGFHKKAIKKYKRKNFSGGRQKTCVNESK